MKVFIPSLKQDKGLDTWSDPWFSPFQDALPLPVSFSNGFHLNGFLGTEVHTYRTADAPLLFHTRFSILH